MNGYTESDKKVQARWNAHKQRDDAILTARANHAACLLAETMRDCDNCKFQPAEVAPWDVIPDSVTVTKPAWMIEAEAQVADAEDYQSTISSAREKPEFGGAAWFAGIDPIPF